MINAPAPTLADGFPLDIPSLLADRLLATAVSGYGKSWLLRRIFEQCAGLVPIIVIDPEGEFHTLREKFDVLICAPTGADLEATPKTAATLARKFLELKLSAVLNIYELKAHERLEFVRLFLESMMSAPQKLWSPVLIIMDEAHLFCPEGSKAESSQAVIDVATRGRKRGFGLCLATQRLSRLSKDCAAQMQNKLIGKANLDLDINRAASELGRSAKQMTEDLRGLKKGEFYAYGPAFADGVHRLTVGGIATSHPRPGERLLTAPPAPSAKIRGYLADALKDLSHEAEREAKTAEDFQAIIQDQKRTIARLADQAAKGGIPEAEVQRRTKEANREGFEKGLRHAGSEFSKVRVSITRIFDTALLAHASITTKAETLPDAEPTQMRQDADFEQGARGRIKDGIDTLIAEDRDPWNPKENSEDGISRPQQTILDTLAQFDTYGAHCIYRTTLAIQSGVSPASSGFSNNLGSLRTAGLIAYPSSGMVTLTDAGRSIAKSPARAKTLAEFQEAWYRMLPAPQAAILRALVAVSPTAIKRDTLAEKVGSSPASSGFSNNLGRLRTMDAIEYPASGFVKASALMFPKGVRK